MAPGLILNTYEQVWSYLLCIHAYVYKLAFHRMRESFRYPHLMEFTSGTVWSHCLLDFSLPLLFAVWTSQCVHFWSFSFPWPSCGSVFQPEIVVVCPQAPWFWLFLVSGPQNSWVPNSGPVSGQNLADSTLKYEESEVEFFCVNSCAGSHLIQLRLVRTTCHCLGLPVSSQDSMAYI